MPTLFLWKKTKKAIKVSKLASLAFTYLIEEFSFPALLTKSSKEGMPACNRSKKISWLSMHFCKEKMYDQHQFWQQNKSNFFCFFSMHDGMTTTTYIMNQQQMWNLRKWSHHFSTLSEYPIISCCVKTIAVNQARGRRRSYKNNAQRGAAAWEEHSLYGPHWIRLDAATEHICYVYFFPGPFSAYSLLSCYRKRNGCEDTRWVWIFG